MGLVVIIGAVVAGRRYFNSMMEARWAAAAPKGRCDLVVLSGVVNAPRACRTAHSVGCTQPGLTCQVLLLPCLGIAL